MPQDTVDRIVEQWNSERPDIDVGPVGVIGRVSRLSRLVDRTLAENFKRHGIEAWMYDVLATLRRNGPPYELAAGDLVRQTMITTGAMTNRIDRLESLGYVERLAAEDRRKVIVRLTEAGTRMVDEVIGSHMETEEAILGCLTDAHREQLSGHLKAVLLHLGDTPVSPTGDRSDDGAPPGP